MNIKVGDTVKFLDDVGGGKITKILDKNKVLVLNSDGFEIPTLISHLVLVNETENKNKENKKSNEPVKPEPIVVEEEEEIDDAYEKPSDEIDVYFALVPKNQKKVTDSDLDVFLVNDSNYFISFHIIRFAEVLGSGQLGVIEPNIKECAMVLKKEDIQESMEIEVQLLFSKKSYFKAREPFSKVFRLNAVKLAQDRTYVENDFFDEKALIIPIYEENELAKSIKNLDVKQTNKIINEKEIQNERLNTVKKAKKNSSEMFVDYDLHIHELIDDETGLSKTEILEIQMNHFRTALDKAINEGVNRITFIHGVGNGVLKNELRRELERKYKKYRFQDASFQEYGYGATMVMIK